MGELILCNQMMAALPYYIDNVSLHIYSLEELCYYIENNLYLLEADFMNEELCTWIERELRLKDLAVQLRTICRGNGNLSEFVSCILVEAGYHSTEKMKQMLLVLQDMEQKSEFECRKLRADRYMENKRYINAIYEYRKLLREDEKNVVLVGNVWHNLGKAYVSLFLFDEAVVCYRKAYELNENPESLRECLYACRCMHDEVQFDQIAEKVQLSEQEICACKERLTQASRMDDIKAFEIQLDEWNRGDKRQEFERMLGEWKDTYRKNCRI